MLGIARRGQVLSRAFRLTPSTLSSRLGEAFLPWQRTPQCTTRHLPSIRSFSYFSSLQQQQAAVAEQQTSPDVPAEFTRFDELSQHGIISPKVIDTIVNRMGIHTMTDVQRLTINECLDGADVIAQAKTGTGKTLAFLMPIVQRILRDPSLEQRSGGRPGSRADISDIRALIISPTRELAEQIAVEAKKIVHNTAVKVQTAVGGTQKSMHLRKMQQEGCHILVGTPGRIRDILSDNYSGVRLDNIETFVLDEADRLLDIGFMPEIEEIQSYMPSRAERTRQTLMFSATVPKEVVSLVRKTLRPDFKFIRTVDPDASPTHESISQNVVFLPGLQNQMPSILEIATNAIEAHKRDPENNLPFKAIVYFGSTNEVALAAQVFQNLRDPGQTGAPRSMFAQHPLHPADIIEMHSKLTQGQRSMHSERFRRAESAMLFSSDVTARGMDFPNVSHVIQIGLPKSSDDYVHRLGRTGRAGKKGEGWLLIIDDERHDFRKKMGHSGIKIDEFKDLKTAGLDMTQGAQLPANTARIMQMVESAIKGTPFGMKAQVYQSLLGVLGHTGRDKQSIIDLMNDLARYGWGLEKPPGLSPTLVSKLGYSRCRGIEIDDRRDREFDGQRGDRGGYGGGRGAERRGRGGFDERNPFGSDNGPARGSFGGGYGGSRGGDRGGFGGSRGGDRGGFGGGRGGDRGGDRGGFGGGRGGDRSGFGRERRDRGGFGGGRGDSIDNL